MFFGCLRQSSGTDDHPTPNQFLYVYRLMSLKNLIKSPKRASVHSDPSKILTAVQSVPYSSSSLLRNVEKKLKLLKLLMQWRDLKRNRLVFLDLKNVQEINPVLCMTFGLNRKKT